MGRVVDDVTGQPIAGAVVIVSNRTVIAGPTPPAASASPWPMATTDASGSFDVKGLPVSGVDNNFSYVGAGYPDYPHAQWLEIFSPDGHAAYHGIWTVNPTGTTSLGTIMVAMPSAADAAWLAQINSDRMTIGNPVQPGNLTFDSATLETARFWANEMATQGFYAHQCPATDTMCKAFWLYETQAHSLPSSQNIAFGFANGIAAEAAFTAEVANCPGGNWQKCTYAENTGHYINIMSATYWAGVGSVTGLNPNTQSGNTTPFYVEDFVTPMQFGSIQSLKRGVWGV